MQTSAINWLITLTFMLMVSVSQTTAADDYQDAWGPEVGTQLTLSAPDRMGDVQTIESLRGENGLLVFFNRSADW